MRRFVALLNRLPKHACIRTTSEQRLRGEEWTVDNELMALLIEVTSIAATEKTRLSKPIKLPRPGSPTKQPSGTKAAASGVQNIPADPIKQGIAVLAATSKRRAVTAG